MRNEPNQTQPSEDWYLSKYNTATLYNKLYNAKAPQFGESGLVG